MVDDIGDMALRDIAESGIADDGGVRRIRSATHHKMTTSTGRAGGTEPDDESDVSSTRACIQRLPERTGFDFSRRRRTRRAIRGYSQVQHASKSESSDRNRPNISRQYSNAQAMRSTHDDGNEAEIRQYSSGSSGRLHRKSRRRYKAAG